MKCRPFTIGLPDSDRGNRFGGKSPVSCENGGLYLLTCKMEEDTEVSLFINFDSDDSDIIWDGRDVVHESNSELISVITHSPALRREGDAASERSPSYSLIAHAEQDDIGPDGLYGHHKFGGSPYFRRNTPLEKAGAGLLEKGYQHALQLMFPDYLDGRIEESWPFGEYGFHLFANRKSGVFVFKYCWG